MFQRYNFQFENQERLKGFLVIVSAEGSESWNAEFKKLILRAQYKETPNLPKILECFTGRLDHAWKIAMKEIETTNAGRMWQGIQFKSAYYLAKFDLTTLLQLQRFVNIFFLKISVVHSG